MPYDKLSHVILELFPRTRAIPAVKECWHLPETDTNDLELEDDGALLELMIAGEERGFVALYRKYHTLVYRFALQVSGICHIAEDVTQETFLVLIRAPHKYQAGRGPLLLYLFGIARNLVWKNARRDKLFATVDADQELPAHTPDFVTDMARKQQLMRVRRAVQSLPRKYREVIVLCCLQELSYEQAATVIGSSIGTVRSRMHRGKQLLLQKLKETGFALEALPDSALRCSA